jgi:hypothetical protein
MGYTVSIEYAHEPGSTSVGTWMSLPVGDACVCKFRVDDHPSRAQRIVDLQRGVGDVQRALGTLAKVSPDEWVIRRLS